VGGDDRAGCGLFVGLGQPAAQPGVGARPEADVGVELENLDAIEAGEAGVQPPA
jgi:hypothetical protein